MPQKQANILAAGVYRIFWKCGGRSVGAIGKDHCGDSWFAPANWISGPSFDWRRVERVELIERAFANCDG